MNAYTNLFTTEQTMCCSNRWLNGYIISNCVQFTHLWTSSLDKLIESNIVLCVHVTDAAMHVETLYACTSWTVCILCVCVCACVCVCMCLCMCMLVMSMRAWRTGLHVHSSNCVCVVGIITAPDGQWIANYIPSVISGLPLLSIVIAISIWLALCGNLMHIAASEHLGSVLWLVYMYIKSN